MKPFSSRSLLIRNEAGKDLVPQFQKLTVNFLPATTRIEMLEDREHTVIPMVMLTEGVHTGSSGPLFYSAEELSKTPEVWNHKPVVVYHPELNGQGISACDPLVVNARKIGVMMNTSWDAKGKRLKSEAWIEKSRAEKIDNRIFAAVDKNNMMELSTGLFSDLEKSSGKFDGDEYDGIIRNIRPDHLALLPDKIGACSITKGAGLLRNELAKGKMAPKELIKRFTSFLGLTENETSFAHTGDMIRKALADKLNTASSLGGPMSYPWVQDVYSNFFIYQMDDKLFRLSYEVTDTGVTLGDEVPVEVKQQVEYRTVEGASFVGNQDQPKESDNMNKVQMIAAILTANCGWSDQKVLEGLNDKQVAAIHKGLIVNVKPKTGESKADFTARCTGGGSTAAECKVIWDDSQPTTNESPTHPPVPTSPTPTPPPTEKPAPTLNSWLDSAPVEVANAFRVLLQNDATEKAMLIEKITANGTLGFAKHDLDTLSIANLRTIGKLAEPKAPAFQPFQPLPNYTGMAPAGTVQNEAPVEEEVLMAPVINFRKESKTATAA